MIGKIVKGTYNTIWNSFIINGLKLSLIQGILDIINQSSVLLYQAKLMRKGISMAKKIVYLQTNLLKKEAVLNKRIMENLAKFE